MIFACSKPEVTAAGLRLCLTAVAFLVCSCMFLPSEPIASRPFLRHARILLSWSTVLHKVPLSWAFYFHVPRPFSQPADPVSSGLFPAEVHFANRPSMPFSLSEHPEAASRPRSLAFATAAGCSPDG